MRSRRRRWIGRAASCAWRAFTDPDGDDHDHEPDHRYTFSNRASTRAQPEMNGRVPSLGRRRQQGAGEGNRASAPALLKERPSCGDQHTEDADVERQMHRAKVEDDLGERGWLHAGAQEPVPHAVEGRSEEHTSELQSQSNLVCRLLLEKKKKNQSSRLSRQTKSHTLKPVHTPLI